MSRTARARRPGRDRRGSALILVMIFSAALAMLALSAIYLTSSATILGRAYERERDLRYAAEAGLAIGKSRLNSGGALLPTSGYVQLVRDSALAAADGTPIEGIRLSVYVGPTGGGAGSTGRYASVVAEVRDLLGGGRFVRRLELAEESFARFAYFTDRETSAAGDMVYFGRGDAVVGPAWSNDALRLYGAGIGGPPTFRADVGTAGVVERPTYGVFEKGYREHLARIATPSVAAVSSRLQPLAAAGRASFTADSRDTLPSLRIEFFAMDMNADGDSTDADEGFFKVYRADLGGTAEERLLSSEWLAGDFRVVADPADPAYPARWTNCGDWHLVGGQWQFFPLAVHAAGWFNRLLQAAAATGDDANAHTIGRRSYQGNRDPAGFPAHLSGGWEPDGRAKPEEIMDPSASAPMTGPGRPAPRCFLGGDPHLVAVATGREVGGTERSFYELTNAPDPFNPGTSLSGSWVRFPGPVNARVAAARAARGVNDAAFVFPLHPALNPGSVGVIHVDGSVGVSGVVNGPVTLFARNSLVVLDDVTYATSPLDARRVCGDDALGLVAGEDVVVADNGLNTPQDVVAAHTPAASAGSTFQLLDDRAGLDLQAVVMSLGASFRAAGVDLATYPICTTGVEVAPCAASATLARRRPAVALACAGQPTGRGCISLFGGVIQQVRGTVGEDPDPAGAYGFGKQYDYDRCAATHPPPFFPTIGRYTDNRYYEVDPQRFSPAAYFAALAPRAR
ncbi:MAG: hypothetical protein ACJ8AO_09680 [Gemmatimonadaceae bacterium]